MNKTEPIKIDIKSLLLILEVSLLLRIIPLISALNWTDLYDQQALPILRHLNIYSTTHRIFPYSPVSMFLPAFCAQLSQIFKIHFYIIMRLPAIIADVCIALSVYVTMVKLGRKDALLMGLLYALNPVAILICSFHGNIMSIPVLFSFLAYSVLLWGVEENYRLSALLLGLAIGFRGYPILLLPLFLFKLKIDLNKKIEYIIYSAVPTALSFLPFLILDYKSVIREVFAYSGFPDYGIAAIIRAIYSYKFNVQLYDLPNNMVAVLSNFSKDLFFIVYAVILLASIRKKLITSILSVFLIFYFIYTGMGSQYFLWILPFCFLVKDKMVMYFLIFVTWALFNFYWVYHPYIIFGRFGAFDVPLKILLAGEVISLILVWVVCMLWAVRLIVEKDTGANHDLL